jgi:nucleotide-binding universal stress UspA family protein
MYRSILVPLDGSATSASGLREAIALAQSQPSTLHLVHVVDDYPVIMGMPHSPSEYERNRSRLLEIGGEILRSGGKLAAEAGVQFTSKLREATAVNVADAIVEEAKEQHCGLIVMGTHGRKGISRLALGSEAEGVARISPVPVMLVRQEH